MLATLRRILLGSPLTTAEEIFHRLRKVEALAVFSSDALSSVAYATEEILLVLIMAGPAAIKLSFPISVAIAVLLAIVASSYYQTIHGYSSGGGAYIVAHDNLGAWPGLTAGAALLTDYVLTVAVSITAGIAAITSAFPSLDPFRTLLCLAAIALIAWANLRGVRESGTLFLAPTYAFVGIVFLLIIVGLIKVIVGRLEPLPVNTMESVASTAQPLTLFLVLRAFASGCTALTGVEAISNGIPVFQKPEAENAGKTLIAMALLLMSMFLGISFLARAGNVIPTEHETVVSQIGRRVFGNGPLYLALQAATAIILVLAANTSFADFPRLSAILARDHYLPRQLMNLGHRLVFANGIVTLAVLASALVIIFGGRTHRLIPLYAVGVFLSFTLSQAGMVRHWYKLRGRNWQWKTAVNSLGATATGIVLLVIVITKFVHGAWVVVLLIPAFVLMFHTINRHYRSVAEQLSLEGLCPEEWTDQATDARYKVVVPIASLHRGSLAALQFARSLSKDVTAVLVDLDQRDTARARERWPAWGHDIPLVVLESPYRSTIGPLIRYLEEVDKRTPESGLAIVVLPEFVPVKAWHRLLHNQTAPLLKRFLVYQQKYAGHGRILINVPYYLTR